MDADDYVSLNIFEELYKKAEQYHTDVVAGLSVRENRAGIVQIEVKPKANGNRFVRVETTEERKRFLQEGIGSGVWGKLYRKDFILSCNLQFPKDIMYEDNYWAALLRFSISSYYIINEPYYHYVENEESTITKKDTLHHLNRLVIELMKIEEYKKNNLLDTYHDEIEYEFLMLYFVNTMGLLFTRFQNIPYNIIYTMQKEVLSLFPHYEKNPYFG